MRFSSALPCQPDRRRSPARHQLRRPFYVHLRPDSSKVMRTHVYNSHCGQSSDSVRGVKKLSCRDNRSRQSPPAIVTRIQTSTQAGGLFLLPAISYPRLAAEKPDEPRFGVVWSNVARESCVLLAGSNRSGRFLDPSGNLSRTESRKISYVGPDLILGVSLLAYRFVRPTLTLE